MTLTLKLRFYTRAGQSLWVTGNHRLFGNGEPDCALPLTWLNHDFWQLELDGASLLNIPETGISYSYIFRETNGATTIDWGRDRRLSREMIAGQDGVIVDSWNVQGLPENAFATEPFRKVLLRDETRFLNPEPARITHVFRVKAPLLKPGQTLALLGNCEALGNWDPSRAILLNRVPGRQHLWASLDLSAMPFPIEYKYGVFDVERNAFLHYEDGGNRRIDDSFIDGRRVWLNDGFAVLPATTWKGAGVAIPVFSLRSEKSFGVGEFTDLKPLADWCKQTGLKLIQILPINDTVSTHTWVDSYPYSAISAFALHPVYLNLEAVATGKNKALLRELEPERVRLNALPEMDYEAVMRAKLDFLKRIFPSQKDRTFRSKAYKTFLAENEHWLAPYAMFCFLRDRYGTADSSQWPAHRQCIPTEVVVMTSQDSIHYEAITLHYFIQFHLHEQLRAAAAHAHANGVVLKGDIAIGVSRHGADTWQNPELYDLTLQAGAPPDPFSDRGQNWGFPTYNWPRMMQDGFAWWKQRFGQMGNYFDAFRVDHILGFFRIWSIPIHAVEGILGYFVPAIPVGIDEFASRGIVFDRERFVEPFITDAILGNLFDAEADKVRETFLQPSGPDRYALKPEFATQRQIDNHFSSLEATPENRKLKKGLFELVSNVILIETDGTQEREHHFRFHIEKTSSFRDLDASTQAGLFALYVDYFFRRQDGFWRQQAMQKLPTLKRVTDMLICGEDLGLVPDCVPGVMKELGLLSLEIQRMPKVQGVAFSRPTDAPYLSVVTPSTHDMSTIRGWWIEDPSLTQRFYNEELGRTGIAPETCSGELNEAVVRQHLASPAMWSIFQLQDLLGMDESLRRADADAERINVPANPKHYWRYRMHLTLESLLQAGSFNGRLQGLLKESGR
jgi:4-alpha-glucanotransferase